MGWISMDKAADPSYTAHPIITLELPLRAHIRIARPEQVVLKIGMGYHDLGSYCYALRSNKTRKKGFSREVVQSSFLKHRPKQVCQVIKALDRLNTEAGKSLETVFGYASHLKIFIDWADANKLHNCLAGGEKTKHAFEAWYVEVHESYKRHEISGQAHNAYLAYVSELLELVTGLEDLRKSFRKLKRHPGLDSGTEPAPEHDFAHALALNQALFDGLCRVVLENKSFPYKLEMPNSLGWKDSFLWVFPEQMWSLPPHVWGSAREKLTKARWAYDYEHGRLATIEEISRRYTEGGSQHSLARVAISNAQNVLNKANSDDHHWARFMLGMLAYNAFMFLFFANTGCNESVARQIETEGKIDLRKLNQSFRSIKYRACGKPISLRVPVAFLPSLRRFMELRSWVLKGSDFPYLFFSLGEHNAGMPTQILRSPLVKGYTSLLRIDPNLPNWGAMKIRATVSDHYQRHYNLSVTAQVLQNTVQTAERSYNAGSLVEHRAEMSLFLEKVAEISRKQLVMRDGSDLGKAKPLEEGGHCDNYGHPKAVVEGLPIEPDCKLGQGCLFCQHRVLIASEEDARKVASAAFVMEQMILGPLHEITLRPLIRKCDDDLEKIANFPGCREMACGIKKDVFENGNLTPFFADKFQLFLDLGVIV